MSDDFITFIETKVKPLREQEPERLRLDGEPSGGNRTVFARFTRGGKEWTVNGDSHIKPLMRAYEAALKGEDPFIEEETDEKSITLSLNDKLRGEQTSPHKHIYIYRRKS